MATVDKTKLGNTSGIREEMKQMLGQVPGWVGAMPDAALPGFWSMMRDFQLAETAIPNKYKELIGLAVSGATRCRYCALFHTEAAKLFGATDQEIGEASMMAAHTMGASTFVNAMQIDHDAFKRETLEIVSYVRAHMQPQDSSRPSTQVHA
ncbi:MAG TPA: carboxymuconolactone decarboxylase family protein [Anaeromyxobacteraceae bacterium]|nr:carboxymuconolactone decarboxylase family protein [Anaeromyxobacteraceae bacterium]